jgi:hypothetical protein
MKDIMPERPFALARQLYLRFMDRVAQAMAIWSAFGRDEPARPSEENGSLNARGRISSVLSLLVKSGVDRADWDGNA